MVVLQNKHKLYGAAFRRILEKTMQQIDAGDKQAVKRNIEKIIWFGVKDIITSPKYDDYELNVSYFESISNIKGLMATMTLKQFMNVFPIKKDFDGHKWGSKDYFYTKEYIEGIGLRPNDVIGEYALELFAEYWNDDIRKLFVKSLTTMSTIRRYEGHLGLFEEFMAAEGEDTPDTFKDEKGQAYYVSNGKPQKIKMNKVGHLRVIK
ncbi:hypothetical protein [Lysinibacillus parviboronicapiens]|uniref:hypothetical protein n=1 Tax=Lysinibacillus parviboronicapiens TaxID=436516 RepID=UPI000D35C356|nr:hypothetical protein [Lysinibacillus parviboronicapiens]